MVIHGCVCGNRCSVIVFGLKRGMLPDGCGSITVSAEVLGRAAPDS